MILLNIDGQKSRPKVSKQAGFQSLTILFPIRKGSSDPDNDRFVPSPISTSYNRQKGRTRDNETTLKETIPTLSFQASLFRLSPTTHHFAPFAPTDHVENTGTPLPPSHRRCDPTIRGCRRLYRPLTRAHDLVVVRGRQTELGVRDRRFQHAVLSSRQGVHVVGWHLLLPARPGCRQVLPAPCRRPSRILLVQGEGRRQLLPAPHDGQEQRYLPCLQIQDPVPDQVDSGAVPGPSSGVGHLHYRHARQRLRHQQVCRAVLEGRCSEPVERHVLLVVRHQERGVQAHRRWARVGVHGFRLKRPKQLHHANQH